MLHFSCLFAICLLALPATSQTLPVSPLLPEPSTVTASVPDERLGQVVFANDNAKYGAAGFAWPWQNTLQFHFLEVSQRFQVATPKWDFVWDPQWLSDGSVMFKFGDLTSSYATYSVARWNVKSSAAQVVTKDLNWKIILPSPNGRFLAYIRGGGEIPLRGGTTPTSLCTYDLQTQTEQVWPQGEPLPGTLSWTPSNTLLFSLAPTAKEMEALRANSATAPTPWHPAIYEADPFTRAATTRIDAAWRANVSPDDQWVAYYSFQNPALTKEGGENTQVLPDESLGQQQAEPQFLVVARRDGSQPQLVREETHGPSPIFWLPDSQGFLLCETRFVGGSVGTTTEAPKSILQVTVNRYSLTSQTLTRVGSFRYFAPQGTNLTEDNTLYKPIKVTNDGLFLVGQLLQFEAPPDNGLMLHAFNLQTGKAEIWAHIGSVRGLDWKE